MTHTLALLHRFLTLSFPFSVRLQHIKRDSVVVHADGDDDHVDDGRFRYAYHRMVQHILVVSTTILSVQKEQKKEAVTFSKLLQ